MAKKKIFNTFTFNIVLITTILLITFGVIVATIGYTKFNDTITERYNDHAFYTCRSIPMFFTGDDADAFLRGEELDKHALVTDRIQRFCEDQGVAIIYVIAPEKDKDYKYYYSVVNCPSAAIGYTPWPLGKEIEQTGSEYWDIYRDIMENGKERAAVVRKTTANGAVPHINVLVPLKRADGTVAAIICVQQTMDHLKQWGTSYVVLIVITTVILAILSVAVFVLIIRRQFVIPIHRIRDEAQRFAKENSEPEMPIDGSISRIHEISSLADALSDMELDTLRYIKNLSQASADRQKIVSELSIAQSIQQASLNTTFPAFPDRGEFDLFASMHAAKQVGGDFYDFFLIDEDHLGLVIADVSGKGVPAALFMMVTKILISERALTGGTPAEILEVVNKRICARNLLEMFVTVWFGILEISTGKIIAANAGHDNPAIMRNGRFELYKAKRGLVIGAMDDAKYTNYEFTLEKGDKLFIYTDGVPEATNSNAQMFTLERMLEFINSKATCDPKTIIDEINTMVDKFVGEAPQFDDITMLCLEYKGTESEHERILTIGADIKNLPEVNDFVDSFLESHSASPKARNQVLLALEEVFANVAHYAYPPDAGNVKITERIEDGKLTLIFADYGVPYNPLEKTDPDFSTSIEERKEGGLGIYMTKKLVDNITYKHVDNQNILTLEKTL